MNKLNLKFNERVKVIQTGSVLDGQECTVEGLASYHVIDTYIVRFDKILFSDKVPFQSISITEACLERVK